MCTVAVLLNARTCLAENIILRIQSWCFALSSLTQTFHGRCLARVLLLPLSTLLVPPRNTSLATLYTRNTIIIGFTFTIHRCRLKVMAATIRQVIS